MSETIQAKPRRRSLWRRYRRDTQGSVYVEALFGLSFMLWAYLGIFTFWTEFRLINITQKASYAVSDMISRQMTTINDAYITGMNTVLDYMLPGQYQPRMRVTSVRWVQANNRFEVHWSRTTDTARMPVYTTTTLQNVRGGIPAMSDGDYVMLVETEVDYHQGFLGYLESYTYGNAVRQRVLKQFIVTRPRFVPRICISTSTC